MTMSMKRSGCRRGAQLALALVLGIVAAGCGPKANLLSVLPGEDGHVGAVALESEGQATLLDKPYAALQSGGGGAQAEPLKIDAEGVTNIFAAALAIKPIPPASFTLYFVQGTDVLTPASRPVVAEVFKDVFRRRAAEVTVIGHTDTVGSVASNDALGMRRAAVVRDMLIAQGLPASAVDAVGRGQRELLVPTGDQVSEERNRRVEITVR